MPSHASSTVQPGCTFFGCRSERAANPAQPRLHCHHASHAQPPAVEENRRGQSHTPRSRYVRVAAAWPRAARSSPAMRQPRSGDALHRDRQRSGTTAQWHSRRVASSRSIPCRPACPHCRPRPGDAGHRHRNARTGIDQRARDHFDHRFAADRTMHFQRVGRTPSKACLAS